VRLMQTPPAAGWQVLPEHPLFISRILSMANIHVDSCHRTAPGDMIA
jgi:hypothetical protein